MHAATTPLMARTLCVPHREPLAVTNFSEGPDTLNGGSRLLRNVSNHLSIYTVS
jgi:hypothetical protein